jgi:preprotein translocase SecE subunit
VLLVGAWWLLCWASRTCGCASLALLVLLAAAVAAVLHSEPGKQLIGFGRESVREGKKVVWPTRKEAMQMTGYVFAFVFVMALFLFDRQDARVGAVRPDPGLEALRTTRAT